MERMPQLCSKADVHSYFQIMERIGKGSYGSVYKAKVLPLARMELPEFHSQTSASTSVAVKEIESVTREIEIMKLISGPNVLRCYGCFTDDLKRTHIVMELCEGITLFERTLNWITHKTRFSRDDKQRILKEVAIGISTLHDMDIAHRDIAPSNIMLCGDNVKIIDYGFSIITTNQRHLAEAAEWDVVGTFPDPQMPILELSKYQDIWAWGQLAVHTYSGKILLTRKGRGAEYQPLGDGLDMYQLKPAIVELIKNLTDPDKPISQRPSLQNIIDTMAA